MEIDHKTNYLTLNLKWGIENYIHKIGINVTNPSYMITDLYYKGIKLSKPEFLYKFYSPTDYNFESLENPYLYFGNPSEFNDSFDCIMSNDKFINTFLDQEYTENIGICNFTTMKTNQMWAYYADKSKGFAIKFKNNKLFLPYNDEISIKSHVLYLKNNIPDHPNLIEALKSLQNKHVPFSVKAWQHQVLFHHDLCRKNKLYQWESEYRVITFKSQKHNRKFYFNPLTIDSIYIGHKMTVDNVIRMKKIIENLDQVKVFRAVPNPKKQIIEDIRVKKIDQLV